MKENKKSKGLVVVIVILVILLIASLTYICYVEFCPSYKNNKVEDKTSSEVTTLDVDSTIVQYLYNSVTSSTDNYVTDFIYGDEFYNKDYIANSSNKSVDMKIVGMNINESKQILLEDSDIAKIPAKDSSENYYSAESYTKETGIYVPTYYAFSKTYVETIYKKIFGENAKLDTSIDIYLENNKKIVYIKDIDKYVIYYAISDATYGGIEFKSNVEKVESDGKELVIYAKTEKYEMNSSTDKSELTETINYKYIFELEDNNNYKYISRTIVK